MKLSIPIYLKFWKIETRFRLYLDQTIDQFHAVDNANGNSLQFYKHGIFCILSVYGLIHLTLLLVPFSHRTRLLLHDLIMFYNLPQIYNWIFVLFAADSMYFQYSMHRRASSRPIAIILLRKILYDNQDGGYFLREEICLDGQQQQQQHMATVGVIQGFARRFFQRMRYFVVYVGKFASSSRLHNFMLRSHNLTASSSLVA